ncbi:helix-turn-helix domain-containing protein [Flavobacterium sp. JRM]|uniref:helix-turn-helix domain-containing protein n=1 Tax=Flavobacterium sp. PS2 TaxID=3384157 RepID=UPI00057CE271|nr:hypothetical protein OA88_07755 [Flavobacterium sp. JRM]
MVGAKIMELRKIKKLSQFELSNRLGISLTALCDIESGKNKKIDFLLIDKICNELDVEFNYFLENPNPKVFDDKKFMERLTEIALLSVYRKIIKQYEVEILELKQIIKDLKRKHKP